jgi:hypothetical protein
LSRKRRQIKRLWDSDAWFGTRRLEVQLRSDHASLESATCPGEPAEKSHNEQYGFLMRARFQPGSRNGQVNQSLGPNPKHKKSVRVFVIDSGARSESPCGSYSSCQAHPEVESRESGPKGKSAMYLRSLPRIQAPGRPQAVFGGQARISTNSQGAPLQYGTCGGSTAIVRFVTVRTDCQEPI